MKYFEDYKVDGSALLVPDADVEITGNDLDSADSGRDESGVMHRIMVRSRVKTWEFHYSHLTEEEYRYMKNLFNGKSVFQFSFPEDGITGTVTAYCSGDSITYRNARTGLYGNYKIKIVEC